MRPILLIRPLKQSLRFANDLRRLSQCDLDIIISPLIQIKEIHATVPNAPYQAIIFTSVNAVEIFAAQNADRSSPAFCVGSRTAVVAQDLGFNARSANGDVRDLVELIKKWCKPNGGALLYIRGQEVAFDLQTDLTSAQYTVTSCVVYRQVKQEMSVAALDLVRKVPVCIPLFSTNSAQRTKEELVLNQPLSTWFPCISRATAEPVIGLKNSQHSIADTPNAAAVIRLILQKSE